MRDGFFTYYVNSAAAAGGNGTTPALIGANCAFQSPKTAVDAIQTNGDGVSTNYIYITGTFTNAASHYMYFDHVNHDNLFVIGSGKSSCIISSLDGRIIYHNANVEVTVQDITISEWSTGASGVECTDNTGTLNINNIDIIAPDGFDRYTIYNNGAIINCNKIRIYHVVGATGNGPFYGANDAVYNWVNSLCLPKGNKPYSGVAYLNSTGTHYLDNSHVLGSRSHGITLNNGTLYVRNSMLDGGLQNSDGYALNRSGGTLRIQNSKIMGNPFYGNSKQISGAYTDDGGNVLTNDSPVFKSYPRKGFILVNIDDRNNLGYAEGLGELLNNYGYKGTFFVQMSDSSMSRTFSADEKTRLRALVAGTNPLVGDAMEVACHSDTHSQLSIADDTTIFDVAGGTFEIDRTNNQIVVTAVPGGTITTFKSKTLDAIKTEMEGFGLTVTPTATYTTTFSTAAKIWKGVYGEALKTAPALSTAAKLLVDGTGATGYLRTEMADPKTYLADTVINGDGNITDAQTGAAYVCNSFGCPYNGSATAVRTAAIALTYTNLRGMLSGETSANYAVYTVDMDMFKIYSLAGATYLKGGATEAEIRKNARAMAHAVAHNGMIINLMVHTTSDLTLAQWGYVLEEWAKYGSSLTVTSHQVFQTTVAAGWTDDGDGTYSRNYGNSGWDHHPDPGSDLLRSGTAIVGITSDFDGSPVPLAGGYNIGPYNNQYVGGGLSPGLSLSGGNRPPWWNRRRR